MSLLVRIKNFDAHHRAIVSGAVAFVVALLTSGRLRLPVQIVVTWNAFGYTLLALVWFRLITAAPAEFRSTAKLQDSSRLAIFFAVIIAACMSVFAVGYLLGTARGLNKGSLTAHVLVSLITVVGSWNLIHTIFALRYAHTYYGDDGQPGGPGYAEGLLFPTCPGDSGEPAPNYMDFAYFSYVIGMTCQVSDVQIVDQRIRRMALFHGLVAFAFNTVILALSINIVSGLFAS